MAHYSVAMVDPPAEIPAAGQPIPFPLDLHSALDAKMGLELFEATPQRVAGRMPIAGNTQPMGLWHGGASCVLAETLASIAANLGAAPDKVAYGIELNASHHRPGVSGWVNGVATALRIGGSLATYEVVLTDDHNRLMCTARVTCMTARPRP